MFFWLVTIAKPSSSCLVQTSSAQLRLTSILVISTHPSTYPIGIVVIKHKMFHI